MAETEIYIIYLYINSGEWYLWHIPSAVNRGKRDVHGSRDIHGLQIATQGVYGSTPSPSVYKCLYSRLNILCFFCP